MDRLFKPWFRPIVLSFLRKQFGHRQFYQTYRPTIDALASRSIFLTGVYIKTVFLCTIWFRLLRPKISNHMDVFIGTPRILGTFFIWTRHPTAPPIAMPQYKSHPSQYDAKEAWNNEMFEVLITAQDTAALIELQSRNNESDWEISEAAGWTEIEKHTENNRSKVLKAVVENFGQGPAMAMKADFDQKRAEKVNREMIEIIGIVPVFGVEKNDGQKNGK